MGEKTFTERWLECDGVGCDAQIRLSSHPSRQWDGWQKWHIFCGAVEDCCHQARWLCPECNEAAQAVFGKASS